MSQKRSYDLRLREGNLEVSGKREDKNSKKNSNFYRSIGITSELGFVIAFPLVGGIFLGNWLDSKFSSYPKCTLSLLLIGVVVSFCNLIVVMREFIKKE